MVGWVVGILESNAKLNSKLRLKLNLKFELSLATVLIMLGNHKVHFRGPVGSIYELRLVSYLWHLLLRMQDHRLYS